MQNDKIKAFNKKLANTKADVQLQIDSSGEQMSKAMKNQTDKQVHDMREFEDKVRTNLTEGDDSFLGQLRTTKSNLDKLEKEFLEFKEEALEKMQDQPKGNKTARGRHEDQMKTDRSHKDVEGVSSALGTENLT
mmetsp:Transcript_3423/g.5125  ORF Transcript_3423/g.5125 Transcript_3423/m.5125 type:complete len:134 (+) Transcript_3423:2668-3069(+)